jgi:hypothetical protein
LKYWTGASFLGGDMDNLLFYMSGALTGALLLFVFFQEMGAL